MKKGLNLLFKVLFAPLLWLVQACSPLGKPVDKDISDNFYYSKDGTDIIYSSMGNWFELGKSPLNADANSFQVLNEHVGKDKKRAYYREHALTVSDLDLNSFTASRDDWMWHVAMDKNKVYALSHDVIDGEWQLITKIVEGADPKTFVQYEHYWSKDEKQHFYNYDAIPVDFDSFELINDTFAKDTNSIFLHYQGNFERVEGDPDKFQKIDRYYARNESNIYYFLNYLRGEETEIVQVVPFTNAETIKIMEEFFLLVDDKVYYKGIELEGAKGSNIKVLDYFYAKDDQRVYYQGLILKDADASSFRFDETKYKYRDKNHFYQDGLIWEEEQTN